MRINNVASLSGRLARTLWLQHVDRHMNSSCIAGRSKHLVSQFGGASSSTVNFSTNTAASEKGSAETTKSATRNDSQNGTVGKSSDQEDKKCADDAGLEEVVSALEALKEDNRKLQSTVQEYQEMNKDLLSKYKLALADTENLRKRMERQVKEAKEYGIQSFCKDLLEVPDILRAAIESVREESLESGSKGLKDMHEGLKMTESVLLKVFAKHGLTPINPLGEKFDPNLHEALFPVPADSGKQPNTVGAVAKVGYCLHGRPVRAAKVGVVQ